MRIGLGEKFVNQLDYLKSSIYDHMTKQVLNLHNNIYGASE